MWLLFGVLLSGPTEVPAGEIATVKATEVGEVAKWILPDGIQAIASTTGEVAFTATEPGPLDFYIATIVDGEIQIAKHRLAVVSPVATQPGGTISVVTRAGCDWCAKWQAEIQPAVIAAGWRVAWEQSETGPWPRFSVKFPNDVQLEHTGFMSIDQLRSMRDKAFAPR